MEKSESLQRYESEGPQVVDRLRSLVITDAKSYALAADFAVDVKTAIKDIETERKKITKPLNDAIDAANGFFKKVRTPFEESEAILKEKIAAYLSEAKRKEAEAIESFAEGNVLALVGYSAPTAPGVSPRTKVSWAVSDANVIPDEYWCLDEKKIGADARAGKEIPGITVVRESTIALSTRPSAGASNG